MPFIHCRFAVGAYLLGAVIFTAGLIPLPAGAADWPHWRGSERNGHTAADSGWERGAWPLQEPLWSSRVGAGASSPIIVGERLYVLGRHSDEDALLCLDAGSGEELWRQTYAASLYGRFNLYDETWYLGPSSTPEYDLATGMIYTLGNDGDLNAWDAAADGALKWHLNLYDAFGAGQRPAINGQVRDYGYTTAPLVHGEWVIVEAGAPEGSLVALDKHSGALAWTSEHAAPAGHSGALVPLSVEGIPCVAVLTLHELLVVRVDEENAGATVALIPWETFFSNNIPTPTVHGDLLIITSAFNISKTAALRITLQGVETVWESRTFSGVGSPVVLGEHVYLPWQRLRCLDLGTGEMLWEGGSFGHEGTCLATADGRLIVHGNRNVALVESAMRSPEAYQQLAVKGELGEGQAWPHVTVAGGRLYTKDRQGLLQCFSLAGQ